MMILYVPVTTPPEGDACESSPVQMENAKDSLSQVEKELLLEFQVDSPGLSRDLYHSSGDSIWTGIKSPFSIAKTLSITHQVLHPF